MRKKNVRLIADMPDMTVAQLVETTVMLRDEAAVESPAFRHVQDRPLAALEAEQARRCVSDPGEAYDLARLSFCGEPTPPTSATDKTAAWLRSTFPTAPAL